VLPVSLLLPGTVQKLIPWLLVAETGGQALPLDMQRVPVAAAQGDAKFFPKAVN